MRASYIPGETREHLLLQEVINTRLCMMWGVSRARWLMQCLTDGLLEWWRLTGGMVCQAITDSC